MTTESISYAWFKSHFLFWKPFQSPYKLVGTSK